MGIKDLTDEQSDKLWQDIKRTFRKLTPTEVAAVELADAELTKLQAQTAMEFAASVVDYNITRIARLKKFLAKGEQHEKYRDQKEQFQRANRCQLGDKSRKVARPVQH